MARTKDKIIQAVKSYIKLLSKDIKIEKVILFGSYANGKPDKWSDIDLAIFSSDFKKRNHLENLQLLALKTLEIDYAIEALPYTPEEYENADPRSFLAEIKRTGVVVQ